MELIKISTNETGIPTVNGIDLYKFLDVERVYSSWINGRIRQYHFTENIDFKVYTQTGVNPLGGRPSKEYHLCLDMAKELAMVERNEKGREVRKYFIDCENKLRQVEIDLTQTKAKLLTDESYVNKQMIVANHTGNMLLMSDTSKIRMINKICEMNGLPKETVPQYTSEPLSICLTDLLIKHGSPFTAQVANTILKDMGHLETKSRRGRDGSIEFKSITELGIPFGKNETYVGTPRQTSPLYFDSKFSELLTLIEQHWRVMEDANVLPIDWV